MQEFVHFILPHLLKGYGGSNAQQPIILVQPKTQFTIFGANVSNVTLVIIAAALVFALLTDLAINRTKFGRGIRAVAQDPTTATLMGVSRERIIMMTFLLGGLLAGAAALLYTLKVPQGIIYSGGFLLGIKAFSAAVLGGIGNLRGALLGACCWVSWRTTARPSSAPSGVTSWHSCCSFWCSCSVPPGYSVKASGRHEYELDRNDSSRPATRCGSGGRVCRGCRSGASACWASACWPCCRCTPRRS